MILLPYDITYMYISSITQINLPTQQKQHRCRGRVVVVRGRGLGEGWSGKLGLADAS